MRKAYARPKSVVLEMDGNRLCADIITLVVVVLAIVAQALYGVDAPVKTIFGITYTAAFLDFFMLLMTIRQISKDIRQYESDERSVKMCHNCGICERPYIDEYQKRLTGATTKFQRVLFNYNVVFVMLICMVVTVTYDVTYKMYSLYSVLGLTNKASMASLVSIGVTAIGGILCMLAGTSVRQYSRTATVIYADTCKWRDSMADRLVACSKAANKDKGKTDND